MKAMQNSMHTISNKQRQRFETNIKCRLPDQSFSSTCITTLIRLDKEKLLNELKY